MELKVSKEITCKCILGDPGADIGAGESLNGRKRTIFFRPFRLSLAPTICPCVSEDDAYVNDKIRDPRQTNISPEHYF